MQMSETFRNRLKAAREVELAAELAAIVASIERDDADWAAYEDEYVADQLAAEAKGEYEYEDRLEY